MKLIKSFITGLCLLTIFSLSTLAQNQNLFLVPNPQQIEFSGKNGFSISNDFSIELHLGDQIEEEFIFSQIQDELKAIFENGYQLKQDTSSPKIIVSVKGVSKKIDRLFNSEKLGFSKELGKEGYVLKASDKHLLIGANDIKGAFYGVQTLKQLIRTNRIEKRIPGVTIRDWPDLEIRAIMDDISRGPVPTKEYMRQQIKRMSEMKINMLTYYTEHVVKTNKHPTFAPEGGSLDIEEWAELADYAKKYHIDLVGNFQSFGHFSEILKHPEYAHLGESGMLLSPAFDESYELLEDIYTEMIPAFHSDYFHINSDETFDLGTGASKAMVDSLGKAVVYANHIKRIHKIVTGLGKKVLMWGDIILENPEILDMLPKDIIQVTWGYDIMDDYAPRITPFMENDFKLLVSTAVLNSRSVMPDFNVSLGNIGGFMAETVEQGAWGMLNTVWDDNGFALFSRDWYGVSYAADQSWKSAPNDKSYANRFNRSLYGATNNGLSDAISTLNELSLLKSTEKMNDGVLWEKVIPEKGESVLMNIQDWKKVSEITKKANSKLQKYDPIVHEEEVRYIQHVIDLYQYLATSRPDLVQAATYYREAKSIENQSKINTRALLTNSYDLIAKSYSELLRLKVENQTLWLKENRVHALDHVMNQYNEQLKAFEDVKELLLNAIFELDKGNSLPDISEVRLDIRESEGWYFQGWLMFDPIPNENGFENPEVDHLEGMQGIENTFPNVTQEFYFDDVKYRWRRVDTPYFAKVDLAEIHGQSKDVIGYAFAHIDIDEDRDVRALAGSSDGIEVFLNGKKVHSNFVERSFTLDEDEMMLPLKKGRNHLMIRVTNLDGDWAFSFRLPDSEMRSSKNRYKIIE